LSKEFIEGRFNNDSIVKARKQQEELSYFTQSSIQEDITQKYLDAWADRHYRTEDQFLNWVKTIFKEDNFLSVFKYLRHPIASSSIVNDRIKTPLARVFFSEDAHFKYIIRGQEVEAPEGLDIKEFNDWMFNALLFNYNDIMITDLKEVNQPFRQLVPIDKVVAIQSHRSVINRVAFSASVNITREDGTIDLVNGFLYIDDIEYIFYDEDINPVLVVPHDLGECPADYIAREAFKNDDVVRKSIFSYSREQLEEYVFLKTLQRMTEPNGAIPIITKLKTATKNNNDSKNPDGKEPMSAGVLGSQRADFHKEVAGQASPLQTGTIIEVPLQKKADGSIDTTVAEHLINFHFLPVESLDYLKKRIVEVRQEIIVSILGDFTELNPTAVNELQIGRSYVSKEDKLRSFSLDISRIRERSDFKFLALKHGRDSVINSAFYGSDFFLETQAELYKLFSTTPNIIERKNILIRLTKNRNRFNKMKSLREVLLYELLPYISDKDFETAIANNSVDPVTFEYQTRFNYWVGVFESTFQIDILTFLDAIDGGDNEKLVLINNLIIDIITKDIAGRPEIKPTEPIGNSAII